MSDIDELYGLPPAEFTAARDALAKKLRAQGDREASDAVKRLRRPTAVAWAINRAAREHPEELRDLLGAGEALRRAHERLVEGSGDRSVLREASEHERAAVAHFTGVVRDTAAAAGEPLSEPAISKVRETLRAATLDDDVRAALESGRLERDDQAIGTAGLLAKGDAPKAGGGAAPKVKRDAPEPDAEPPAAAKPSAAERRAAAAAHEEAVRALREADRAAARAERACEKARRRTDRAESAVEDARARLEQAERELESARGDEEAARQDVRQAKEALAAAQTAVDDTPAG